MNLRTIQKAVVLFLMLVSMLMPAKMGLGQRFIYSTSWGTQGKNNTNIVRPGSFLLLHDGSVLINNNDGVNANIKRFSQTGELIGTIGTSGTGLGQLQWPTGMEQLSNGDILVGDYWTERIQVFGLDGAYKYQFTGVDGVHPAFGRPHGLSVDAEDNVYVVGENAGIWVYRPNGTYVRHWSTTQYGTWIEDVVLGPDGNLYVSFPNGNGVVVMSTIGQYVRTIDGTSSGGSRFTGVIGLRFDASGLLYITDTLAPKIRVFTPYGQEVASFGDVGTGFTKISRPLQSQPLPNGTVLVSEENNSTLLVFRIEWPMYRFKSQFGSTGAALGNLDKPWGLAVSNQGNIYVSEYGNQRIQWFSDQGVSLGSFSNSNGPNGTMDPLAMSFAPSGDLYVADRFNHRVVRFDASSGSLSLKSVIGSFGTGQGQFNMPHGLSVGPNGNVHVADLFNVRVTTFDSSDNFLWSSTASTVGNFDFLHDTAVNNLGDVLVADTFHHRVVAISSNGVAKNTFGSFGTAPGQMYNPKGIGVSRSGLIAVPEEGGNRVQLFLPDYSLLQVVGGPGPGNGLFNHPIDAAFDDRNGVLYISDHVNNLVQAFEPYYPDSKSPTSTFSPSPTTTWSNTDKTATISSTDNPGGSGVKEIHYSINMGTEQVIAGSSASFTLSDNGAHSISYFALDNAGNIETTQYATVKIDKIAPVTTLSQNAGLITLSATDAHSGVVKIKYQVNGGAVADYSAPFADTVHKVTYWSEDAAGNIEAAKTDIINAGLQSITVSQSRLIGGTGIVGTVTLDKAAGVGGTVINLASSLPGVAFVDPTVTVPEGATTATFDIDANPVAIDTSVSITASIYETSQSALLNVLAPMPVQVTWSTSPVIGGTSTAGTLIISGPAPAGGTTVSLASSSLSAIVGSSVTIPAGAMTASFTVSTNTVSNDTSAIVSATVYGVKLKSTLSILGPKVTSVTLAASSVVSLGTTTGTVTLSTNAPVGGKVVTLSSSNASVASVPVSVTVAAGTKTATFTVTAGSVNASSTATITAATNGSTGTVSLTVTPPPAAISGITTNVAAVTGGLAVTGTVTLTSPAPTGGAVIVLASTPTTAGTVPASVTVAAGATTATFTITTKAVTGATTLTVTGTYLGVAKAASITVNPARVVSTLTLNPTTVKGGTNSTGTITLTGIATENVVVSLTSGTTTVATVPTSVTILAGSSTATFTITTLAQTATRTSIITARTGTTSKTATLSVTR